jgi:hypothetical protein
MKKSELRQIIKEELKVVLKEETEFETTANILDAINNSWIKAMKVLKKSQKAVIDAELNKAGVKGQDRRDTIADVIENFYDLWDNELEDEVKNAAVGGYQ